MKLDQQKTLSNVAFFTALTVCMVLPALAFADGTGLEAVTSKVTTLAAQIMTIIQVLMGICGAILGYIWAKGDHAARDKTERWLVGIVVVFASSTLVKFFT